jgi:hypothetical protein
MRSRKLLSPSSLAAITLALGACAVAPAAAAPPPDVHPRLWVRGKDMDDLRKRMSPSNPVFEEGLKKVLAETLKRMDTPAPGDIVSKDSGSWSTSYDNCSELFAQVLAFMYVMSPDASPDKADYGKRAKTLLMNVIDKVYAGLAALPSGTTLNDMAPGGAPHYGDAWVGGKFVLDLRTFIEDSIPLTVDWIYPLLSAEEKFKIRTVFLYWSRLITERAATTGDHDKPNKVGVYNDPALLDLNDPNRSTARFGLNNWFAMHMRLLGLMSLSMDAADDAPKPAGAPGGSLFKEISSAPAGALREYLKSATGAYLYMIDYGHRNDGRGGLSPEGMQYFTAGLGPTAQFYLALKTSGWDDPMLYPQKQDHVVLTNDPYWKEMPAAFLSQLSPVPLVTKSYEWLGPSYQPAFYGDGEKYSAGEMVNLFGALARYYDLAGDAEQAGTARWIAANISPGGASQLTSRIQHAISNGSTRYAILYFLGLDPNAKPVDDPRLKLPLTWYSAGLNSISARTGWDGQARWLSYMLPWSRVDHQHGEANMIQFFRKGEWMTKKWVGYGPHAACSEYSNTVTVLNDPPSHNSPGSYQNKQWASGSQWQYINAGDPLLVGWSDSAPYTYAYGDATPLYNSKMDGAMSTAHVSRSVVWIKPDHLVVYDRVASKKDDRFKRFWLSFENEPKIDGTLVTETTKGGQSLFVRTLLPEQATRAVKSDHPMWDGGGKQTASGEPMAYRLMVEAPNEKDVRFLHVLQGADAGAAAEAAQLVRGTSGTAFEGAVVHDTAVLFPRDFGEPATTLGYTAPASVKLHVVTGLAPEKGYSVTVTPAGDKAQVLIAPNGDRKSDKGGVLAFDAGGKAVSLGPAAQGGAASLDAIKAAASGLPAPGNYGAPGPAQPGNGAPGPTGNVPPGSATPHACGCGVIGSGGGALSMMLSTGALVALLRRVRRRRKGAARAE